MAKKKQIPRRNGTARQTARLPSARAIKAHLDTIVVGQERPKRTLAVAVVNHFARINSGRQRIADPDLAGVTVEKSNVLMIGPTGCGKTYLARALAEKLNVPFSISDATSLTEAGYVGQDVENILVDLIHAADDDIEAAQKGIVYLDEFDKIRKTAENISTTRDVGGEGVQQSILKMIEGGSEKTPVGGGRFHPEGSTNSIDTTNILFICGGAFVGLEKIISERLPKRKSSDLMSHVMPHDLIKFGILPELVGRLPIMTALRELTIDDMQAILTTPKNALLKRRRFAENPLVLPKDISIIEKAIDSTGAKLVVIDPLPAFLGNPNSEASVRKALSELAILAEAKNLAVVIVRHLTKGRSSQSKYRGSGSIGIIASARSALFVGHDPSSDDPHQHVLALNKSNLADAEPLSYRTVKHNDAITVEWLGKSTHTVDVLSESGADNFHHSQLEEACYVLFTILSEHGGPMPAKEVQESAKPALVSPRTLKRAKKKLGVTSRRSTGQIGEDKQPTVQWVWELPKADARLRPYKDRAMKDTMQDSHDDIDEVTQPIPATTEPEDSLPKLNDRPWEEYEECDPSPEPVLDVSGSRPWDD